MKANLFLVGGPKCGTTTVANWLAQHPDIFMSGVKEPNFYNTDEHFDLSYSEEEYVRLYEGKGGSHTYRLDASAWYMASACAIDNILEDDAGAMFVCLLRNPVEMAISLHAQELVSGNESVVDFSAAWNLQSQRRRGEQLPKGCYSPKRLQYHSACSLGTQVEACMTKIPPRNLMCIFLEDLEQEKEEIWSCIQSFLEVDHVRGINFDSRNMRRSWKSTLLRRIAFKFAAAKKKMGFSKSFGLMNRYAFNRDELKLPDIRVIAELYSDFESEIELISELTGRNLDHWNIESHKIKKS